MNIKFGVITKPFGAEVHQTELRPIESNEVLIKMEACNICTGDYTQYIGLRDHQGFPHAGGHEWTGIIVEKGAEVIDYYAVGDRVAGVPGKPCGQCRECLIGNVLECETADYYAQGPDGYYGDRLFATYAIQKASSLVKISSTDLPPALAAMLEPLSTCVQASKVGEIKPGDIVVVVGAGTMGILNAQVAHAYGGKVYITDLSPKKLERAASMGFADAIDVTKCDVGEYIKEKTNGKGADVAIVCVGNDSAYKQALQVLRENGGRIVAFPAGYPKPKLDIEPNDIHYRRMKIVGAYGSTFQDFYEAEALLSRALVDVSYAMEGKEFPLSQYEDALKYAAEKDRYRVTVNLTEAD